MQLVTPNGHPRWLAEPDDWAAVKNQRAVRNVTQPIRFQGQWHDEESGLYYNRHRYYDPQQGRYISQDPIGLLGGMNFYNYTKSPTTNIDPMGLSPRVLMTAVAGAQKVAGYANDAWCVASYTAMSNSASQLPPIVEQQIEKADEAKASSISGCESDRENRRALLLSDDVIEGEFNACVDRSERNYNRRITDIAQENSARHSNIDDQLSEIYKSCREPSFGDLGMPNSRK